MTAQVHVSNTTSNEGFNSENDDVTCPRQRRWERSLLGKPDVRRLTKVISGTDYKGLHVASHSCLRHERTITGGAYITCTHVRRYVPQRLQVLSILQTQGLQGLFPTSVTTLECPVAGGNGSAHTSVTSSATLQLHTCTCESLHEY